MRWKDSGPYGALFFFCENLPVAQFAARYSLGVLNGLTAVRLRKSL